MRDALHLLDNLKYNVGLLNLVRLEEGPRHTIWLSKMRCSTPNCLKQVILVCQTCKVGPAAFLWEI